MKQGSYSLMIMITNSLPSSAAEKWLYGLLVPFIYVVVEFSFNHRLITALDETVSDAVLENLEFWGRLIAGVGLGLMIHRLLLKVSSYRFLSLVAALSLGIVLMWHLQQSLINYFVELADPKDKRAAVLLNASATRLLNEEFKTLQGDALTSRDRSQYRPSVVSSSCRARPKSRCSTGRLARRANSPRCGHDPKSYRK
jgi:hypothetical protein